MYILQTIGNYFNFNQSNSKTRLSLDHSLINSIQKKFYVIHTKTTGPSKEKDRLTYIDVAQFKNGMYIDSFTYNVDEENEKEIISSLALYLEEAMISKTPIYIGNSSLELDILTETFERYHVQYHFNYFNMSIFTRKYMKEIDDIKSKKTKLKEQYPNDTKSMIEGKLILDLLEK